MPGEAPPPDLVAVCPRLPVARPRPRARPPRRVAPADLDFAAPRGLSALGLPPLPFGGPFSRAPGGAACAEPSGGLAASAAGCASDSDASSLSSGMGSSCLDDLAPVAKAEYACVTSDGVKLVLVRGSCPGAPAPKREHPVLLVPGLASSADATWDVAPARSLFDHLARQGYDVWRVDLRGAPRA